MVVVGDLDIGGLERHVALMFPLVHARGLAVAVYALTHKGTLSPALESAGVPVHAPGDAAAWECGGKSRKLFRLGMSGLRLYRLLRRRRPRAVHFFLPTPYLIGATCALLAGCRIRIMSRRSRNLYHAKYPLLARYERALHRRMTRLVGNSRAVLGDLVAEGAGRRQLALLYNGVDTDRFRPAADRDGLRRRLGFADDELVIIAVANLIPYKGHADLLDALASAADQLEDFWTLSCPGRDQGIGEELAERARTLGIGERVRFLGPRDDVPDLVAAADIAVLCSHEEGFSNSVLEYMASGTTAVVTDVGGNAEAVIDGECGVVVPPKRPDLLGGALADLAKDPAKRRRLGDAGRERVLSAFSLDSCLDGYMQLYRRLGIAP